MTVLVIKHYIDINNGSAIERPYVTVCDTPEDAFAYIVDDVETEKEEWLSDFSDGRPENIRFEEYSAEDGDDLLKYWYQLNITMIDKDLTFYTTWYIDAA